MAIYTGPYKGARSCTSGPQPGAWGAMDWFLSAHADDGGLNTGIYNCRSVRGGRTTSLHGEGRAADFGIRPYSADWGWALAKALVAFSKELGIQCVIWDRRIWSSSYPHSGFRKYNGVASHADHIHVEFTWARANAGRSATAKHYAKVLGGVKPEDVKIGGGGGGGSTYKSVSGKTPTVRLYRKGEPVKRVQRAIGAKVDGYFGPDSVAKLKSYQRKHGLAADGICGAKTWAVINGSSGSSSSSGSVKAKSGEVFPWPSDHWAGVESKDSRNHSGYHARDRDGIKTIQRVVGVKADGVYGSSTRDAVIRWQKANGLPADGYFGAKSWAKMDTSEPAKSSSSGDLSVDGLWGKSTTRAIQRAVGVKPDGIRGRQTVRAIQRRVGAKQDGIWGRETIRGIQRRVGVKADGIIGKSTVRALQRALNAGTF